MSHPRDDHMPGANTSLPRFPGEPGEKYRKWKQRLLYHLQSVPDDKQKLVGPQVLSTLDGEAAELFSTLPIAQFRTPQGLDAVFAVLDPHYSAFPEIELAEQCHKFFHKTSRHANETATQFATRFRQAAAKLEAATQAELQREASRTYDTRMREHRDNVVGHLIASQDRAVEQRQYDQALLAARRELDAATDAGDQDEVDRITELIDEMGPRPDDIPIPVRPLRGNQITFQLPQILKGALFLHSMSLPQETIRNVVRNASGRTDLDDVVRLVRSTEASTGKDRDRHQPRHHQRSSYVAQEEEEWVEDEWEEQDDEEEGYWGDE
jgi:hypothetical protein